MKITKAGTAVQSPAAREDLAAVNAMAKTALTGDEIYTFSVLLCDNEVDRDYERFTEKTLGELRELFVGRTGIADHDWTTGGQKARIYRTELVTDPERKNSLGMPYVYLKGCAYMLRTERNAELIAEIEGGIKRETSVGCSVARTVCSICGKELGAGGCSHVKGLRYEGKLCYAELDGAVDAYEWSFVAVPAQKSAGVMKKHAPESEELRTLRRKAELGDRYLAELRAEVLRLGLLCDRTLFQAVSAGGDRMDTEELQSYKKAFEERLRDKFPPLTQLPGRNETVKLVGEEYRV